MAFQMDKEHEALLKTCMAPLNCLSYALDYLCRLWLPITETTRKRPGLDMLESDPMDTKVALALAEEVCPITLSETSLLDHVLERRKTPDAL